MGILTLLVVLILRDLFFPFQYECLAYLENIDCSLPILFSNYSVLNRLVMTMVIVDVVFNGVSHFFLLISGLTLYCSYLCIDCDEDST